jgi:hypothetical protein
MASGLCGEVQGAGGEGVSQMPEHYLLLGAGFSRNWGGWLSSEVNEFLLGDGNLTANLKDEILCRGGFEAVLGRLQSNPQEHENLLNLQSALRVMFLEMNTGLLKRSENFDDNLKIRRFLAKFDAIFTLNQDVFLESCYVAPRFDLAINCPGRWDCAVRPGLPLMSLDSQNHYSVRVVVQDPNYLIRQNMQPYFKLHGSSDLLLANGRDLLIMGSNKGQQISDFAILKKYQDELKTRLSTGHARLMIIGYSFLDEHIDKIILDCCKENNLKLFVINPLGVDVINQKQFGNLLEPYGQKFRAVIPSLIGASRRNLTEIFNGDEVEGRKLERFFVR